MDGGGNLYITDNVKNEVVKETQHPDGSYSKSVLPLNGLNGPLGSPWMSTATCTSPIT